MNIAAGQSWQPLGGEILMSTRTSSVICCKYKKSLWSLILYVFFMILYMHVYSPRAGADSPQGTKFQQKVLITLPICFKFQRNLFEVWFYTIFFMIKYIYIAPRQGAYSPQGTEFWCQQELLVTYRSRSTQGHHLNKLGSTRAADAAYQVSRSSAFWFQRRRFLKVFTIYMGMVAILVMWPGQFEQAFVPPSHGDSIWNLALISPPVSEEMFKECGQRTDRGLPIL